MDWYVHEILACERKRVAPLRSVTGHMCVTQLSHLLHWAEDMYTSLHKGLDENLYHHKYLNLHSENFAPA